ncbi:plancitoxin-1-like [Antedon mediterranea]|uniref:plancitoxin-1-like n=1 Tax=Antedon mediterranea TaxID=105859 RepID=UPI003AF8A747
MPAAVSLIITSFLFIVLFCHPVASSVGCLDSDGKPIDWFIVLKLHRNKNNNNTLIKEGVAHQYMDANSPSWRLSSVSLNDSRQAIGYTLQQIYDNSQSQDVGYVMYNDEFPDGTSSQYYGHTKGTLGFDSSTAFWLIHSTPKFPEYAKSSYVWPYNALKYGQSFLCISVNFGQLEPIGGQLLFNHPHVYDYNIPDKFGGQLTNLSKVVRKVYIEEPTKQSVILTSQNGVKFTSFSKAKSFEADIYEDWLNQELKTSLLTETWQNGATYLRMNSSCDPPYQVHNINTTIFPGNFVQYETLDHSKWAISDNITKDADKHVCIGGINRMTSQEKRAGGTVCFNIPAVWQQFHSLVTVVEKCRPKLYPHPPTKKKIT